jgi:(2Fe-2S) ferredoxin
MSEKLSERSIRKLQYHIFVCFNERAAGHPRGCCKSKNAEALLQAFKAEVASAGLAAQVRAQKSGCLDVCEWGAAVVVYPDGVWYGQLEVSDVPEIVKSHLVEGRPVERLRLTPREQ